MRMKKVEKDVLINEEKILQQYAEYLRSHGYIVFRMDTESNDKDIQKAKEAGCKIEFYKDALVKVDPSQISSSDDIVLYFYERLKRSGCLNYNPQKLKDKKAREVDRSVIRHLIEWRVASGISFRSAIEEIFIMIDTLFEMVSQEGLDIRSASILSVNTNKFFVMDLLRKAHVKQDIQLRFDVEKLIENEDLEKYSKFLEAARIEIEEANKNNSRKNKTRKKIKI